MLIIAVAGRLLTGATCRPARHDPGHSALRDAPEWRRLLAITWERTQRHPHHRHPAPGAGQRGAGAAGPLRRRRRHQHAVAAGHPLVAGACRWRSGCRSCSVCCARAVAADGLSDLGTQDIAPLLDWVRIAPFLVFLTFYIALCVHCFCGDAQDHPGRRDAFQFSIGLSVVVALALQGCVGSASAHRLDRLEYRSGFHRRVSIPAWLGPFPRSVEGNPMKFPVTKIAAWLAAALSWPCPPVAGVQYRPIRSPSR